MPAAHSQQILTQVPPPSGESSLPLICVEGPLVASRQGIGTPFWKDLPDSLTIESYFQWHIGYTEIYFDDNSSHKICLMLLLLLNGVQKHVENSFSLFSKRLLKKKTRDVGLYVFFHSSATLKQSRLLLATPFSIA